MAATPVSVKRKLSGRDSPPAKRPRTPQVIITLKPKPRPFASAPIPMPNACPDYPNGFIYCHQCSKKRDVTDAIQCTFLELINPHKDPDKEPPPKEKPSRQRRCVAKFCKFCLKNRYDLDFENVVATARTSKNDLGHIESAGYIYKCPKCCALCNCPRCRKSKGLEPMGSAGTIRRPPPEPIPKPPKQRADRKSKATTDSASASKGPKGPKKPKPKPLPIVKWSPVSVNMSLEDAEARFNIREFILRFADLFEPTLPKANLDELEEIGGGRHQGREEDEEMASWVSEFCVKSIIVGLLNLLEKELHGSLAAVIKQAVKDMRTQGVNLNKIWPILASLRDTSLSLSLSPPESDLVSGLPSPFLPGSPTPSLPFVFTFPDPLPPPSIYDIRTLRSTRNIDTNDGVHIAYSAQMIPVISSLIEEVLLTNAIREEIEKGVREGKEAVKEQREAIKREAERWEFVRKGMETHVKLKAQILENRAKREYHKHKLVSLDNSLKVVLPKYAPRLTPLGTDADSRIYWILSPGVSEHEAASEFISLCLKDDRSMKNRGGKRKFPKAKTLSGEEERREMKSWSWFVAVWGRKPEDVAGSNLWKGKGKAKEKENNSVKLKIKVGLQRHEKKLKLRPRSEDAMEVDDEADRGEDMASVSGRAPSPSSSASSSSSSLSSSEDEGSESDQGGDEESTRTSEDEDMDAAESSNENEDENAERWWGFYDPYEILKLSDWIAIKSGLDDSPSPDDLMTTAPLHFPHSLHHSHSETNGHKDESVSHAPSSTATLIGGTNDNTSGSLSNGITHAEEQSRDNSVTVVNDSMITKHPSTSTGAGKAHFKNLVDELRAFASLLEWRCREDKYDTVLRDTDAAAGGNGSVSASPAPTGPGTVNGTTSGMGSAAGSVNGSAGGKVSKGERGRESTGSVSISSFYGNGR